MVRNEMREGSVIRQTKQTDPERARALFIQIQDSNWSVPPGGKTGTKQTFVP